MHAEITHLQVRFDIARLEEMDSVIYALPAWRVLLDTVGLDGFPSNTNLYEGNVAGTNDYLLVVESPDNSFIQRVQELLEGSAMFKAVAGCPRLVQGEQCNGASLVMACQFTGNGGFNAMPGSSIGKAIMEIQQKIKDSQPKEQLSDVPERRKPASSRTAAIPSIITCEQLREFIVSTFPKDGKYGPFMITPDELCDICDSTQGLFKIYWREKSDSMYYQEVEIVMCQADKREPDSEGLVEVLMFNGFRVFPSEGSLKSFLQVDGCDPVLCGLRQNALEGFGTSEHGCRMRWDPVKMDMREITAQECWHRIHERRHGGTGCGSSSASSSPVPSTPAPPLDGESLMEAHPLRVDEVSDLRSMALGVGVAGAMLALDSLVRLGMDPTLGGLWRVLGGSLVFVAPPVGLAHFMFQSAAPLLSLAVMICAPIVGARLARREKLPRLAWGAASFVYPFLLIVLALRPTARELRISYRAAAQTIMWNGALLVLCGVILGAFGLLGAIYYLAQGELWLWWDIALSSAIAVIGFRFVMWGGKELGVVDAATPIVSNRKALDLAAEDLPKQAAAESAAYFSRLTGVSGNSDLKMLSTSGVTVLDLTSDKEKLIEQEARSGISLGTMLDTLVSELTSIGRSSEFTVVGDDGSGAYDDHRRHKQARKIGEILDQAGGMDLMQAVWYRVKICSAGAKGDARDLSRCWGGIGHWRY